MPVVVVEVIVLFGLVALVWMLILKRRRGSRRAGFASVRDAGTDYTLPRTESDRPSTDPP